MIVRRAAVAVSYATVIVMIFFVPTLAHDAPPLGLRLAVGPVAFVAGHQAGLRGRPWGRWVMLGGALLNIVWGAIFVALVVTAPFVLGVAAMFVAVWTSWKPVDASPLPRLPPGQA